VIGKTNLDEFAMGRRPRTPRSAHAQSVGHLACTGGSSGGSAPRGGGGMAATALGSDTGGSIRQPASFCGVVGMKPTYGRVSRYGLVAFASSLDQIGPFTRSVEDMAIVLNVICGKDARDATSALAAGAGFHAGTRRRRQGLRIGVPLSFLGEHIDASVRACFDGLVESLKREGASVVEIDLPHAKHGLAAYYIIANAEASANLARFDGIRYGHRSARAKSLDDVYMQTREEGFGREVKRRVLLGTYVLSAGYYDAYYRRAQQVRTPHYPRLCERPSRRATSCSLPTAPTPAFKLGEKTEDPILMYLNDIFTIPVNLAGLPGISVPCGVSPDGLPIGAQSDRPRLSMRPRSSRGGGHRARVDLPGAGA
jgi:aspartyl-tRNA(Asn)/glutamyl-tRNA(Gln) amidotransferase subunit A